MSSHGLTKENLVATLPVALQKDPSAVALAEAMAELLARRPEEIDRLRIYPDIDRLDEQLLDILAYDFKVDWWDPEYSIEEKRRTLKDSWRVHKILGTKAAVEAGIRAIYPLTTVEEWFEYGGEPYHFRLNVNITNDNINSDKQRRVLERLNFYKSLRSHNDGATYFMVAAETVASAGVAYLGRRMCVDAEISMLGVAVPCAELSVNVGAVANGIYQEYTRTIPIPETVSPLCCGLTAQTGIGIASVYQKMTKEVPLDGTLG